MTAGPHFGWIEECPTGRTQAAAAVASFGVPALYVSGYLSCPAEHVGWHAAVTDAAGQPETSSCSAVRSSTDGFVGHAAGMGLVLVVASTGTVVVARHST